MKPTRRMILGSSIAALALAQASAAARAQSSPGKRKTFVLVHGAWHGGWCWRDVRNILSAQGHNVFTPTLTGLGERAHLMSRNITLDSHIQDITNVFAYEDLTDVCLVGHSYAGWVISGAIEKVADRVSSIVYLDAFMPENGQRVLDFQPPALAAQQKEAWDKGEVSREPPKAAFFSVAPQNIKWVEAKMSAQPLGVQFTPVVMTGARDKVAKKTYIRASAFANKLFDAGLGKAKSLGWKTIEMNVGHDIMVDAPEDLAKHLNEIA